MNSCFIVEMTIRSFLKKSKIVFNLAFSFAQAMFCQRWWRGEFDVNRAIDELGRTSGSDTNQRLQVVGGR